MMKTRIFWDKFEALLTNKFLKYYYGTTGLKRYLQKRNNLKSALRLREMDNVMFEAIQEVVRLRKNRIVPDAGKYTDGIFLIEEILKRKPKRILECGSGASSIAMARVRLTTPALAAIKAHCSRSGTRPAMEAILMMRPCPCSFIALAPIWLTWKSPLRSTFKIRSHSSLGNWSMVTR